MENQISPSLSSALEKILKSYEETDYILFDPVILPKPSEKKPNSRKSKKDNPFSGSILHSNPQKPLPSLAEDEDTRLLQARLTELQHQSLDLSTQIQYTQKRIFELEKELNDISRNDAKKSIHAPTSSSKPGRPSLISSDLRKTPRRSIADRMTPEQRILDYQEKYYKAKAKLDNLQQVLKTKPNDKP